MRKYMVILLVLFGLAMIANAGWGEPLLGGEKIAVLRPLIASGTNTNSKTNSAEMNLSGASVMDTDEVALRIVPRLASELKWPVEDYKKTVETEGGIVGSTDEAHWSLRFRQYKDIADRLQVRYVASYVVRELSFHNAGSFLAKRQTGRANVDVLVYDRVKDAFVWQNNIVDTSTVPVRVIAGKKSTRLDQAMFNALRLALAPFVEKGERKEIARPVVSLAAMVKQVSGKTLLLDIGTTSDVVAGDVFTEIGNKFSAKVTEILQNGVLAEVTEGTAASGDACRLVN